MSEKRAVLHQATITAMIKIVDDERAYGMKKATMTVLMEKCEYNLVPYNSLIEAIFLGEFNSMARCVLPLGQGNDRNLKSFRALYIWSH